MHTPSPHGILNCWMSDLMARNHLSVIVMYTPTAPILIVLSTLYLRPLLLSLPALPSAQPLPLSSAEDSKNGLQVISSWQAPVPAAAVLQVWFLAHFLHSGSTVASVLSVLLFLLGIGCVVFCLTGIFPICFWAWVYGRGSFEVGLLGFIFPFEARV